MYGGIFLQLEFNDISIEDVSPYLAHWELTGQKSSDYSFPILWGWALTYGYQVAVEKGTDLFWTRQTVPSVYNMAPIGKWQRDNWAEILSDRCGANCEFWLVPEGLLEIWREQFGDKIEAEDDRGNWEYLYSIKDLASLAGNKYMKKRNRVNHFKRNYPYTYEPISAANAADVMDFQIAWCQANHCGSTPGLTQESHGIQRILQHWDIIPHLRGGVIKVGSDIAAYTIGELAGDNIVVHFEKASLEYGAGYQVINKEFLSHMLEENPGLKVANREEDMNDPGLREAKLSYLPTGYIKKYHVKINLR